MKTSINENGILLSALANKYLKIVESGIIQESELNSLFSFLNGGRGDITKEQKDLICGKIWEKENGLLLSDAQNKKGIQYLLNQYKTPAGKERKNSPFGYREIKIIENFSHFELMGEYNAGNGYRDFFVPLYRVVGAENSMEYYFAGGKIHIIG